MRPRQNDTPAIAFYCQNAFQRQREILSCHYIVTDPSGTFIMHTCPLFPLISTCISVPFGFYRAVDYCSRVHWWCEYLCVGAAVMLRAIYIVYYGNRPVAFNRVYPRSFVWVQPSVFVYVFVLGVLKTPIGYSCTCLHNPLYQHDIYWLCYQDPKL